MKLFVSGVALAVSMTLFGVTLFGTAAQAQSPVVENVISACETEITSYCSQVSPGQGRLMACFFAHEDKLSVQCINALYDGMTALEQAVDAISYVASQCEEDINTKCGETVPGEGRIAECLLDNKAELSASCSGAIDEVGLQKAE